jgi:hypothetical protein
MSRQKFIAALTAGIVFGALGVALFGCRSVEDVRALHQLRKSNTDWNAYDEKVHREIYGTPPQTRVEPSKKRFATPTPAPTPSPLARSVPDYRNGKPNALVCPDNRACFQCDHEIAQHYAELYRDSDWNGAVWFLPLDREP